MSRLSKAALITFVVATLAGSCLHFVYALWPNGAAPFVCTWCPPDGLLFRDLSLPTFYSLPC